MSRPGLPHTLMALARMLAPADQRSWADAMQGELAAIEEQGPALRWALGCLAAASVLRLRSEGVYLLMLGIATLVAPYLIFRWEVFAVTRELGRFAWLTVSVALLGACAPSALLAYYRPRRALVSTLLAFANPWTLWLVFDYLLKLAVRGLWDGVMFSSVVLALDTLVPCFIGMALGLLLARRRASR